MAYYFTTTVSGGFDETVEKVKTALAAQGFGVLTEVDIQAVLKKKLDLDFRPYRILGACNPPFAHQALSADDKIGTMLPCNVVVQRAGEDAVEVTAVDPVASMAAVDDPRVKEVAAAIRGKLKAVIAGLTSGA